MTINLSRRNFVGSSLALGAGLSTPKTFGAMEKISIALIGVGSRGRGLLGEIAANKTMDLKAVCDIRAEALTFAKNKIPGIKTHWNYQEILDDKDLDAVVIATPLSTHYPIAKAAIERGKNVYCEKTMAYSIEEALDLQQLVKENPVTFMVGYQYPFHSVYSVVREMVQGGEIGALTHIQCQWNRKGNWRRPVKHPNQERLINWRMYREYSKGLMAELGSHHLNYAETLLGENPQRVVGFGGIDFWKDGRETYDNVHTIFEYPSGVKTTFTSLTANKYGGYNILLKGSEKTIILTTTKAYIAEAPMDFVDAVSGATNVTNICGATEIKAEEGNNPTRDAIAHFGECIMEGKLPISDIEAGVNGSIAVSLAVKSMQEGSVELWPT